MALQYASTLAYLLVTTLTLSEGSTCVALAARHSSGANIVRFLGLDTTNASLPHDADLVIINHPFLSAQ